MIARMRYSVSTLPGLPLRRAIGKRELAAGVSYLGLMAFWIYWLLDRQLFYGNTTAAWAMLALLAGVQVAVGFLVARWWALVLPLLAVVLSVPAGYPSANKGEPLPIWLGLGVFSPIAVLLAAVGVGLSIGARLWPSRGRPADYASR